MLDKSFGLHFYLKKPKTYENGTIPIYLRIIVDGIPKELSTKRACDPGRWNSAAERSVGTREDSRALNAYLDTLQAKVYEAKRKMIESNQIVTASSIKDHLLGKDQRNKMLIKIFENYNDNVKKLIGIDYSEAHGPSMTEQKDLHSFSFKRNTKKEICRSSPLIWNSSMTWSFG